MPEPSPVASTAIYGIETMTSAVASRRRGCGNINTMRPRSSTAGPRQEDGPQQRPDPSSMPRGSSMRPVASAPGGCRVSSVCAVLSVNVTVSVGAGRCLAVHVSLVSCHPITTMMDSAEGLCELVSVLCKLSDEMSLPLSAFFLSFVFFCLSALLFPSVRLFVSSFCLSAFSFARAFSLSASPPAPPGDHSPSDQKRTLILDENARSFWTTNVPNRSAACPCPGGRGWKKQPETTLFPVLPPRPRLVQVLRS